MLHGVDPGVATWAGWPLPWTQAGDASRQHFTQVLQGSRHTCALLTALAGGPALSRTLVQGLLLTVVVLVGFAVSARTGTDAALEGPAAQHLPAVREHSRNREPPAPPPPSPALPPRLPPTSSCDRTREWDRVPSCPGTPGPPKA